MKNNNVIKTISCFLVVSQLAMLSTSCGFSSNISETTTQEDNASSISTPLDSVQIEKLAYSWEGYVGDVDAFVYGALINEYSMFYDVFNATVELSDGTVIDGIGYTNYDMYFETEDDDYGYFPSGFISLIGSPVIPESEIEKGIEVVNNDIEDKHNGYILSYETVPLEKHAVIWNSYIKYGVSDKGSVTYEVLDNNQEFYDESRGALYSYDDRKYLYNPDVGNYFDLTGTSLSEQIDFKAIEDEMNRIIENQDKLFAQIDIETFEYTSKEAINSYLLSLQEETFCGVAVDVLVKEIEKVDISECIRITDDGIEIVNASGPPPEEPTELAKWTTGICCGMLVAGSIALTVFVPAAAPLSAAICGSAIEVFMEVVMDNHTIEDVNWSKVGIAAVEGAVLGWLCPMGAAGAAKSVVNSVGKEVVTVFGKQIGTEVIGELAGYSTLTLLNSLTTGVSNYAYSVIDGNNSEDAFNAFKDGMIMGASFTVVAGGAGKLVGKYTGKLGQEAGKLLKKSKFVSNLMKNAPSAEEVSEIIRKNQIHLKNQQLEDLLVPKSIHEATVVAMNELKKELHAEEIFMQRINTLLADDNINFAKYDDNGKLLSKAEMIRNGGNCVIKPSAECEPELLEALKKFGVTELKVTNGAVQFDPVAYDKFAAKIVYPRDLDRLYDELANIYSENPDRIPSIIKEAIEKSGCEIDKTSLARIFSDLELTLHEGTDDTVYIVDRIIHQKIKHAGGVSEAKLLNEIILGTQYFKELCNTKAEYIFGALLAQE